MRLPKESINTLKVYDNMCILKIISNSTIFKISSSKNGANFKRQKHDHLKMYQEISISLVKNKRQVVHDNESHYCKYDMSDSMSNIKNGDLQILAIKTL